MKRLLVTGPIFMLLALSGGAWWWARQSLPALDGEQAMPGLREPVEAVFDAYGVPHLYARDPEDAWFAAGVMHARERLWQMELYRRVAAGRLSEVMGEGTLPIDKRFLSLGLRAAAEAEWQRAGPELRTALERYTEGVNAQAGRLRLRERPLEMQLLRIAPAEWTPVDSLAVGRLLAWRLAENHQAELVRAAVAAKLGTDAARELGGRYPSDGPTVLAPSSGEPPAGTPPDGRTLLRDEAQGLARRPDGGINPVAGAGSWPAGLEWLRPTAKRGNSNNWVVSGARTASGRPILANDPHLIVEFPSVWYEMHLVAAGLDVAGVTIPGLPFVIIGHNRNIAWGFTNSNADVQDLYLERIDVGRKRYLSASGWQPARVERVEIPVRGRATPEPFDVWSTSHGPILASPSLDWDAPPAWMTPTGDTAGSAPVSAYALRWEGATADAAAAFERLDRANDWTSFVAAIDSLDASSQNAVYADVDGNIGYALSGRLPVRTAGDGTMPQAGAGGAGWVEGAHPTLPRVLNPEAGYLTSSNNEIGRGLPVFITRDWSAPFRAARLREVLSAATGASLQELTALQNDTRGLGAAHVLAGVKQALAAARSQGAEAVAVDALERLAGWDQVVDGRPVVTLYEAFEDAVWRRTFVDEMDEPLFRRFYEWAGAERPAGLNAIVDERQSRWFDDIATVDKRETRDDIFILAARDAAERLRADYGSGAGQAWDRVHAVTFEHALGSGSRVMSWLFSRGPVPMVGDGTTVMRVSWNRLRPFAGWEAPSWRQVLDVGSWDRSQVVLPTGQSGHRLSAHHFDQNELWRTGRYRAQPFSRQAVLDARAHRLLLVP
ncbi:MAG: penicillin acylase family protein [Acidobacteria bacterium]|nr:penicillin acylase family protein [Acidobacteriota bacterium]